MSFSVTGIMSHMSHIAGLTGRETHPYNEWVKISLH